MWSIVSLYLPKNTFLFFDVTAKFSYYNRFNDILSFIKIIGVRLLKFIFGIFFYSIYDWNVFCVAFKYQEFISVAMDMKSPVLDFNYCIFSLVIFEYPKRNTFDFN